MLFSKGSLYELTPQFMVSPSLSNQAKTNQEFEGIIKTNL